MSGSGGTSAPEGTPGAPPPSGFLAELAEAFRRHRPQGSNRWNFSDAFTRLERQFGTGRAGGPGRPGDASSADGTGSSPGARARVGRFLERSGRAGHERAAPASDDPAALAAGFDATVEAFRFLDARVARLEDEAESRKAPVDAVAWLVPAPPLGPWVAPVAEFVSGTHRSGEIVHGECGDGELAQALTAAGLDVRGAEPRGAVAWRAAERGVDVHLGPVHELLGAVSTGSLGGLVLSGVVDRLAVEDLVALLALATDRLGEGAPLVVVGSDPGRVEADWDAVARDLVAGRPLAPPTWELLLTRSGYEEVAPLEGPGGPQAVFALKGLRHR